MNSIGKKIIYLLLFLFANHAFSQETGTLQGTVTEKETGEPVGGVMITIVGTYLGAYTDEDGEYEIVNIKPGDYTVKITSSTYNEQEHTGIKFEAGKTVTINAQLSDLTTEEIEVIGEKNIIDLESGKSEISIGAEDLKEMRTQNVQSIAKMQVGITESPDGIQIRGGRVYETQYLIDGISAQDPLAGTGFGVEVSSNAVDKIEITTGGGDAENGNNTSGTISTKIKEGGEKLNFSASYQRDNLGKTHSAVSWNTDIFNVGIGGTVPFTQKKLTFYTSVYGKFTDNYFGSYANQLHSSSFANDSMWAPRQDNRWSNTIKLTYNFKPGTKLSVLNQHSLNINQNTRSLQIVGNNSILTPGFQYLYSLDMDNATTYTHHSNLTVINFMSLFKEKWIAYVSVGRLFTNLKADANGRPFRESTVDRLYDPASIVTLPVGVYNPNDSVVFVFPGPGLYNNGGISTLWHEHYAQEYTFKVKFSYRPNTIHTFSMGLEHKEQEYQWIDVTRPWLGAPIQINDSTITPSTRIGQSSDVWKANPTTGGFFFTDEIRYKGIIANLGFRLSYWTPGKYADDAINNPLVPLPDAIREEYKNQTVSLLGKSWKARFLPKIRVSFPVTENNVLYFNYGHSQRLPHPRFVYAGLDPVYQDRSYLSYLGNPNLNPEINVNYELGIKSQITKNLALSFTAFYNDKFDYIVSRKVVVKDQTGQLVEKTFYVNQDYARIRGIELSITRKIGNWFKTNISGAYQIATGKSNSAAESALQIKQSGSTQLSRERFLAWDRPFTFKASFFIKSDSNTKLFNTIPLQNFRVFVFSTFQSGLRYTGVVQNGVSDLGRPIYESVQDDPYALVGKPWFETNLRISRDFFFGKKKSNVFSLTFEISNLFNNKNATIINPVTGTGYQTGDAVPITWRDPSYPDPQDNGTPPTNPARWKVPRQIFFGASLKF